MEKPAKGGSGLADPDFRSLFEASPGLYLVLDPTLRIVAVSDSYATATMTVREQIVGRGIFDVFPDNPNDPHADGVRNLNASLQRVLAGGVGDGMAVQKYDIRRPENHGGGFEERYWKPYNSPVMDRDGRLAYIIHQVEDVTEFVRAQENGVEQGRLADALRRRTLELEQAELHVRRLNRVYAVLSDINQSIVRQRDIPTLLKLACQIAIKKGGFGFAWVGQLDEKTKHLRLVATAGATPDTIAIINRMLADDCEEHGCSFTAHALRTGTLGVCNDIANDPRAAWWRDAAIKRHYQSMVSLPLKMDGKIFGTFNLYSNEQNFFDEDELQLLDEMSMDISFALEFHERESERKRLEEQLRQSQKMEAVGLLAGGVAHDFNNILTIFMLHLTMLRERYGQDDDAHEALEEMADSARRANTLTRQLLMLSRQSVIQMSPLDLNESVQQILKLLRRIIGEHIDLNFSGHPSLPGINADAVMIDQIVMNLCLNARDAMPGGGALKLTTSLVEIDAEQASHNPDRRTGKYVCLSVSDTGCGMNAATIGHIFEPFFTTKEPGKGTGLGLATVYGIAKQHLGWVEVESTVGGGSTFRIFLPALSAPVAAPTSRYAMTTTGGGSEIVLLVEDEPAVRASLATYLRRLGYRVLEAMDSPSALKIWDERKKEVDLLYTDMVLPNGTSGLELAQRLRKDRADLKVILSSGYSDELAAFANLAEQRITFLAKPPNPAHMAGVIRKLLDE